MNHALIIDDLAIDRQLAARALKRVGWTVQLARNSSEGFALLHTLKATNADIVIITDLDMPADPLAYINHAPLAGANFALHLRTRMEQGTLQRVPIVALTALNARETHLTARAFGCDVVLQKPATPDLDQRILQALTAQTADDVPVGTEALFHLLHIHLVQAQNAAVPAPHLTTQDITKGLLAHHRHGLVGLGSSTLATILASQLPTAPERGSYVYALLVERLHAVMQLDVLSSLSLLHGELVEVLSPQQQALKLA